MYPSDTWHYSNFKKQFLHLGAVHICSYTWGISLHSCTASMDPYLKWRLCHKSENIMGLGTNSHGLQGSLAPSGQVPKGSFQLMKDTIRMGTYFHILLSFPPLLPFSHIDEISGSGFETFNEFLCTASL